MSTASTTPSASRTEILTERLTTLMAERDQVAASTRTSGAGDIADRATDVEASIQLQLLDERIHALELEVAESREDHHVDGVVSVGDTVTLDLGDGPEVFVVGSVEQAAAGVETVTPTSPLGKAILGASVGATVDYSPRTGLKLQATVVSVA